MTIPFRPHPDGIEVRLPGWLVTFLSDVPLLLEGVGEQEGDPAAERFRPPVYLDDQEASEDWWHWMGSELEESRAADRSAFELIVEHAADGVVASPGEAEAMMRVLGQARLVLAARMGVDIEADYESLDEHSAAVLDTLAQLQEALIHALSETTDDD